MNGFHALGEAALEQGLKQQWEAELARLQQLHQSVAEPAAKDEIQLQIDHWKTCRPQPNRHWDRCLF